MAINNRNRNVVALQNNRTTLIPNGNGFSGLEQRMILSTATTNEAIIKKGRSGFYGISLANTSTRGAAYIRIFDTVSTPQSSDTPIATYAINMGGVNNFILPIPLSITNNLGINITAGPQIGNRSAVEADKIIGSVWFK